MRVLVAGATGVLGTPLLPQLTAAGHEVLALARPSSRVQALGARRGVTVVPADALDREGLTRAVRDAAPDAVVHLLTAIPAEIDPRRMGQAFATTNRLRTEGTRDLLDAADTAGVQRVVAQSIAFGYDPRGAGLATEDTALWPRPARQFASVLAAVQELEQRTAQSGGLVLRLGHLYGPGSAFGLNGSFTSQVRARSLPIVGSGDAVFSFIHARDAAAAVVAALDSQVTGALNIVDDDPAATREWIPELAQVLGAPEPRHIPALVARLAVGAWGVAFMTALRGADNNRAKELLGWQPGYSSWREGFAAELSADDR
ncbi:NAD(P)-dependent oxidoreductase [Rhodococcus sp. X156]|uniref:NAD-dependent epimerase/dehydratase family protein n=1 Tax=Rhodococcus sp. X156 TaxID=2499145 RepID=UPI000FDC2637|nr:NAD(P)-dependent oxidoreductase [Rhodococcus sp. X156]